MPGTWNAALNDLNVLLSKLYPDRDRARLVVKQAAIEPDEIDCSGIPKIVWMRILEEAVRRGKVPAIVQVAKQDFSNVNFTPLEQRLSHPALGGSAPDLPDDQWKAAPTVMNDLEKVIGAQPTFLPVNFLEKGLLRARSVALVKGLGTGFLLRGNLFITNHHVLPDEAAAAAAVVRFNYQKTVAGTDAPAAEYALDPAAFFATSPAVGGDDWTVVRVKGDTAEWGFLELSDAGVKANDYVNIVQHPSCLPKQIALYHNVVVFVNDDRVQYLTDTEPGSSGSPVFDSNWNVVALHHSGGWLPEPGSGGKMYFRNEGIHVRAVLKGLKGHGLLGA